MRLNGISIGALTLIAVLFGAWLTVNEPIYCIVQGAGEKEVNGFYSAIGGMYIKRGYELSSFPDIFGIVKLKNTVDRVTISFSKHLWTINTNFNKDVVYFNSPDHPQEYIYSPPYTGWKVAEKKKSISPVIETCQGSLADSQPINSRESSNIGQLMNRPITSLLLAIIFYYAYYLWSERVAVDDVSYSYERVVTNKEYWRMVTASFAHFDLLHLGFNTMALYQLGENELVYGSLTFLYLNIHLVFITMIICTIIYHVLIHRYGRTDFIVQQAVGFSCVLFAWMVCLSVRMSKYCPIFLFPSLCFDTWFIPLPKVLSSAIGVLNIPINVGPFILLVFTKLIMARSSLIGHLSGIIIGYPLAWGFLNWFTPPMMLNLITGSLVVLYDLYFWDLAGRNTQSNLYDFVSSFQMKLYNSLFVCVVLLGALLPVTFYLQGVLSQVLSRVVTLFILYSALEARRVEWVTDSLSTKLQCGQILLLALLQIVGMFFYDCANLTATWLSWKLLEGCSLSQYLITLHVIHLVVLIVIEGIILMLLLLSVQNMHGTIEWLTKCRVDEISLRDDAKIWCSFMTVTPAPTTAVFGGTARTLTANNSAINNNNITGAGRPNLKNNGTRAIPPSTVHV